MMVDLILNLKRGFLFKTLWFSSKTCKCVIKIFGRMKRRVGRNLYLTLKKEKCGRLFLIASGNILSLLFRWVIIAHRMNNWQLLTHVGYQVTNNKLLLESRLIRQESNNCNLLVLHEWLNITWKKNWDAC